MTLDAFDPEFRVFNTGLAQIEVPISPHVSALQPPDDSQPFSYLSLALVVNLCATGPAEASGVGWVELYGSVDHENSIVTLKPGQWIRVKSKVKLHTWPTRPIEAQLEGNFWLRKNVYNPHKGGGFTDMENVYPNRTTFPAIAVHFSPTRSDAPQIEPSEP